MSSSTDDIRDANAGASSATPIAAAMTVAHDPVPIHKSSSKTVSLTGVTAGAVIISMAHNSSKSDGSNPQAYHSQKERESSRGSPSNPFFLAVMAPNADAAMQFLSNRPPGAHVLMKDEDDNVAVCVKFRQAVRAIVLIKAKEMKKQEEAIEWGRPYKQPHPVQATGPSNRDQNAHTHSTMLTPVHKMKLSVDLYLQIEQCWKRFLPQVTAILLQMCCETYLDEGVAMDNWAACISSAQTPCVVVLSPQSCGFYILGTNSGPSSSSSSSSSTSTSSSGAVPVRHVEFDFQKFVIAVADGTFNPAAFIISTHFSSKRLFDADLTFKLLRDNFLAPGRVMLKETVVSTVPVQQTVWQNCVELNASDPEFTLLLALQSACWSIIPHEPLPDTLLDALRDLHLLFVHCNEKADKNVGQNDIDTESFLPTWPKEKLKMVGQILPYLLELMVAAASGLEWIEATRHTAQVAFAKSNPVVLFPKQKLKVLHQFARVLRFDIVHMVNRCDEATIYRSAHHIFQFFAMRCDLPAEFIELIRDLLALTPEFRVIFLKNQGTSLLWKALHTGERFQLGSAASLDKKGDISPLAQAILQANAGAAKPKTGHERRSSLFGMGRKYQHPGARKSVDFGTTFAIPVVTSVKPLVFMRINPLLVQTELASKLCFGQIEISQDIQESNSVGSKYAFCFCPLAHKRATEDSGSRSQRESSKKREHHSECTGVYSSCKRKKRARLSPKLCMYELVLQQALELLYRSSSRTWEKDAGLLLRLENVHESLFNEIVQQMKDAVAMASKDEEILFPGIVLSDQVNYCRLRVVIKCVSDLFRLELKRRIQMRTELSDKKYWYFIHLFRSELRDFNEYLESTSENGADAEKTQEDDKDHSDGEDQASLSSDRKIELLVHIEVFRWIPRSLLDEWIVLSLEDFLQTASALSVLIERSQTATPHHIEFACQLLQIFRVILLRSTDVDLQTLLVRVLNRGCSAIISLLQHLATVVTTSAGELNHKAICAIQVEIFSFLYAYVTLDLALPTRNSWIANHPGVMENGIARSEDVEVIEQRKAVLMASVLSSTYLSTLDELNLWDYLLLTLVPKGAVVVVEKAGRLSSSVSQVPTLPVVSCFQEKLEPELLTSCKPYYSRLVESFLMLLQQLYVSLVADSLHARIDFHPCISSHMHHIERYCNRYSSNSAQESSQSLREAMEWHLKCLIALGNRRTYFPAITEAFVSLNVVPTLLNHFQSESAPSDTHLPASRPTSQTNLQSTPLSRDHTPHREHAQCSDNASGASEVSPGDPGQDLAPMLRLKLPSSMPRFDFGNIGGNTSTANKSGIVQTANIHALLIILTASFLILDSNFDLDPVFCPRFAILGAPVSSGSIGAGTSFDLLWSLQRHFVSVKLSVKAFEKMVLDLESALVFSTPARVAAVRSLVRLLAPSWLEREIYVKARPEPAASRNGDTASPDLTMGAEESTIESDASVESCTYMTKGAFSTVYRSTPLLSKPTFVAIKVLAHQKRAGDLSVLRDLYNEIAVLKKLQGEHAAIQMLDFGNRQEAQSFDIMMEYCPCTLTEWRASLGSGVLRVPFRSLLVMVLRAFEQMCHSLARVHREGVGHFDGDNILIRTSAWDLTRRLLLYEERDNYESEAVRFIKTCFCFGDFGESMILESGFHVGLSQGRTTSFTLSSSTSPCAVQASKSREQGFPLSRTRGTEAIKSPEMLKIKGSEGIKESVTFSSDVWSMGCLLYEMVTQELMFGKDDAAGLYSHLVISQGETLREDHVQKIQEALTSKDEQEALFVRRLVGLCEKILVRAPNRPSLDQLLVEVQRLLEDILQFPTSADDKRYLEHALSESAPPSSESRGSTPSGSSRATEDSLPNLPNLRSRLLSSDVKTEADQHVPECKNGGISPSKAVICRLFWNLYVGGINEDTAASVQVLRKAGVGDRATSASSAFMDAFEAAHEAKFDHFVYFLWDNDQNATFDDQQPHDHAVQASASSLVNELSEEGQRTCFFINSRWIALRQQSSASSKPCASSSRPPQPRQPSDLDVDFFKQVDLDSHQLFPVFQRLLRNEPGRVLFLGAGKNAQAMEAMNEIVVAVLLFFLQTAFSLGTTETLTFLARECGQLFGYPRTELLLELETYASRHEDVLRRVHAKEKVTNQRYIAGCLCGESVFAVPVDAIKDAMYHHQQQCTRNAVHPASTPVGGCFHPFPSPPAQESTAPDSSSTQYDGYPVDPRMIYDVSEERLMFPFESRSKRRDQVPWVEVDIRSVERLESLFGADLAPPNATNAAVGASEASGSSNTSRTNTGNNASGNGAPLSSRSSTGGSILSFRKKQRRRQTDEQQQLAGIGEHSEHGSGNGAAGHVGMVTALILGLKERSYCSHHHHQHQHQHQKQSSSTSSTSSTSNSNKPRKLYECELCCFPICALASDHEKVAIPLYFGRMSP